MLKVSLLRSKLEGEHCRVRRAESREQRAESREQRAESRVLIKFVVIYMAVMTVAITASEIMAAAAVGITANESVAVAAVKLDRSGQGRCGRGRGYSRPVRRPRP